MTDEVIVPKEQQASWFIDDGIPGVGDRPSWLNEKFKNVAHLAQSYSELEKKFGTAPDEYDLSKSKYIDPDYQPFQDFVTLAKEKRVPKDVVDKMLDSFDKYMDEFAVDPEEEIKKFGDNAQERLTVLDNWAQANLSKDSYEALSRNLKDVESLKALEEIRGKMMSNNTQVPPGNEGAQTSIATVDDLQKEITNPANLKKYKEDENYRKDWQGRMANAAKTSNYIDKVGA